MSEWLELHYDVFEHPKTKRMSKILKTPRAAVVGHLAALWTFSARYAISGDLTKLEDDEIEIAAGWEGKDGAFLQAALTVGYLDSDGESVRIHDWDDYAGKWANRRARNAERMRHARAGDVQGTCEERATHVQRTEGARAELVAEHVQRTGHARVQLEDRTREKIKNIPSTVPAEECFSWWETYGKVGSRADAYALYEYWRQQGASAEDLIAAAVNYRAWCISTNTSQKHGATFLAKNPNRWQEHVRPEYDLTDNGGNGNGKQDIGPPPRDPDPGYCWTKVTNPFTEELEWAQKRGERE